MEIGNIFILWNMLKKDNYDGLPDNKKWVYWYVIKSKYISNYLLGAGFYIFNNN